ncbi:hypothetical protein B0H66DRAFT_486092 [Apodospora peruviana]|uniref:tyrosinase n=1 Tax=Apodospora peruviana TaxID=516989 RepID=A0AAE0LZ24_9PEZI|nr:hypothetical protein B0H66DRAFT_486092 [Apodospora peruviana]
MSLEAVPTTRPQPPNWTDDVLPLITDPYWIPEAKRSGNSSDWITEMKYYGNWDLSKYEDVTKRVVSIYQHLRSKTMPITDDPDDYWPEEALGKIRLWANAGFPLDSSSAPAPKLIIPQSVEPPPTYRIRRDIMSLSKEELAVYQSKLDDILQVGHLDSKWQELGFLHAEWCLHYQEATFLWHRAYLRYVEEQIDFPIPYWNCFSTGSANPDSPFAGVPPVFFEETYVSPKDGSVRPNPLKYALALNGVSKDPKSRLVTRDPVLVQGKSAGAGWAAKIALFTFYHEQMSHSLSQKNFTSSNTAEKFGFPWQNIPSFGENNPDSNYPFRFDFDELFEQVHDNIHGWVGPDMADNSYTAFDPIFLSYHANMDRLTSIFLDSNPTTQLTSRYPLQPFLDNGTRLAYDDPRRWIYTTIGDMAKDTRALGYTFAPPLSPDVKSSSLKSSAALFSAPSQPNGGRAISLPLLSETNDASNADVKKRIPYVIFTGVGCTTSSYRVDVFTPQATSMVPNPTTNPDFIGQVTRIGMGRGRVNGRRGPGNGRCRKPEATRVLSAERVAERLLEGGPEAGVKLVVTGFESGQEVGEEELKTLSGFEAKVVWLSS